MTTSLPHPPAPALEVPDPRTVRAWIVYRESLRGLAGEDYAEAEARAWDRLQRALAEIAGAPDSVLG